MPRAVQQEVERGGLLQAITQAAGLLGGVVALIYFAGAVVLSLRLAIEHLPWSDVVSQLPREVVLSVGGGHVLLPALLVAVIYALYRMIRGDRCQPPELPRARDGKSKLPGVVRRILWIMVISFMPLTAVVVYRTTRASYEPHALRLIVAYIVLGLAAIAIHESRAVLTHHYRRARDWKAPSAIAAMGVFYCLAAVPAMVVMASSIPLNQAKVCMTGGTEERGVFVGQSSQMIYLGENRDLNRRLAILPVGKVEELFIGPEASEATCEAIPVENEEAEGAEQTGGS